MRGGLFIGSIGAAANREELIRLGITHVLSLGTTEVHSRTGVVSDLSLSHLKVNVEDKAESDLAAEFYQCFDFIDQALGHGSSALTADALVGPDQPECQGTFPSEGQQGRVLVHCFQGKSRSAAVICAYLIRREGLSFADALGAVRAVRPQACPNLGFAAQLRRCERLGFQHRSGNPSDPG